MLERLQLEALEEAVKDSKSQKRSRQEALGQDVSATVCSTKRMLNQKEKKEIKAIEIANIEIFNSKQSEHFRNSFFFSN